MPLKSAVSTESYSSVWYNMVRYIIIRISTVKKVPNNRFIPILVSLVVPSNPKGSQDGGATQTAAHRLQAAKMMFLSVVAELLIYHFSKFYIFLGDNVSM